MHAVPVEAEKGHPNLWNWSHRMLVAMWGLRSEPGSPGKVYHSRPKMEILSG